MGQRNMSAAVSSFAAAAAVLLSTAAFAAPPINVSLTGGNDGLLQYTVKVDSKLFGSGQQTRQIRSGETDDFTWKSVPPSGAVPMANACPRADSAPRDANGAMVRQAQVRVAPSVNSKGIANVQLSFQASAPNGTKAVTVGGNTLQCPNAVTVSQVKWLSLATNGDSKSVMMGDGTKVTLSIKR